MAQADAGLSFSAESRGKRQESTINRIRQLLTQRPQVQILPPQQKEALTCGNAGQGLYLFGLVVRRSKRLSEQHLALSDGDNGWEVFPNHPCASLTQCLPSGFNSIEVVPVMKCVGFPQPTTEQTCRRLYRGGRRQLGCRALGPQGMPALLDWTALLKVMLLGMAM